MNTPRRFMIPVLLMLLVFTWIPRTAVAAGSFSDIGNQEFAPHVQYIAEKGIISGYKENGQPLFKPYNPVTRFQAAKMLVIATGNSNIEGASIPFSDVRPGEQHDYISKAVKLGYFRGYPDGYFRPNEPLTRGQMSKVIAKAFKMERSPSIDYPLMFTDVSLTYTYAPTINGLYYGGVTRGANGKFSPNTDLSRAHFSMFLARAMDTKFKLDVQPPNQTIIANARVNTDLGTTLNIRSAPSVNGQVIGKLQPGTLVGIVKNDSLKSSEWVQIRYSKGPAYINADEAYVTMLDSNNQEIGLASYSVRINTKLPNDPTLNVRSAPSTGGVVTGKLKNGDVVDVYSTTNGWHLILLNGLPGYISAAYTEKIDVPATSGGMTGTVVAASSLNVRQGPSTDTAVIGKLSGGQQVTVRSVTGWWAEIDFNGRTGYIHKMYLKIRNNSGPAVKNRIIVLDAGHGAKDPGATKNGVTEKSIVLKVAQKVERKLKADGAIVHMSRSDDTFVELADRVKYANSKYADSFVSIHVNAAGSSAAKGAEVFFNMSSNLNSTESKVLATKIQNRLVRDVGMYNRGVKDGPFYVIRENNMPAVLVELGFITNPQDFQKLTSDAYLERYAQAIYNGIVDYYK